MTAVPTSPRRGVRLAGTGSCLPDRRLTNADLEKLMDTSDEWIVQRTGVRERRIIDRARGESCRTLSTRALTAALADAKLAPADLDLLILATISMEMACPPTSCRVLADAGAGNAGAMDVSAACCGWVFSLNMAHDLIRGGSYRTVAVIGCDTLSDVVEYTTEGRACAIIFGDAAAGAILRVDDDPSRGILAQSMHADGSRWKDLYIPRADRDFPPGVSREGKKLGIMQMNGREVFKFAVTTFGDLIDETLAKAGLRADQVDHYICHQSNARILEAARERFGLPREKLYVNIDRIGNSSSGSIPLCLDELRRAGRVREGQTVMFVAFGGGLTWGSSLWRL